MRLPRVLSVLVLCILWALPAGCQVAPLQISNCDDLANWRGGIGEKELVKEGAGAVRWDHGQSTDLRLQSTPADWSAHNTLSFWLYSPQATGARFMLIVPSENPDTEGMDYYQIAINVDFEGWKQFSFGLRDDVGTSRKPRGLDQIDGLYFTASGWGNTPDPGTVVIVDDIRLTWEAARLGPRMTDEEFFEALNLDYAGLEQTRAAVEAGNLQQAKEAFVQHLLSRAEPRYYAGPADRPAPEQRPQTPNTAAADRALGKEYSVVGFPLKFEDEIDWTANPSEPFNPEWTWQFGRHHWWGNLARAYWDTGDEKYAQHFVWEMRSWVQDNPMPRSVSNSVGSRWRTIECGIRLAGSWPNAFFHFLGSPSFTADDVVMMVKSMAEQAQYLHSYPTGGNWLTMEANGMGHVGVLFPEFKRAQTWREDAVDRLNKELDIQVYPDGPQKELSPGYHFVALGNFLGLARIHLHNDRPLPPNYVGSLERMWAMGLWAATPDRNLPHVNDSWDVNVRGQLRQALDYFPAREDFRWIATDGKEGAPPDHTSHFFPWAGWAVMRSDWTDDARYLFLDVGPFGLGHQHEDKLAFVLHAYGKNLVLDVGSYAYDVSKMRRYVVGPHAHNIVFVDEQAQHRGGRRETYVNDEPQDTPWLSNDALDYCAGVYDNGFGAKNDLQVTHRREVLFVKPDYWLVMDTLTPQDDEQHLYESLLHLGTEDAVAEGGRAWTVGEEANLQILTTGAPAQAEIVKGQEEPYYLGWIGKHGVDGKRPIPVARFAWTATGETKLLYVLYPTKPGDSTPAPTLQQTGGDNGNLTAELSFADGAKDVIRYTAGNWEVRRVATDGSDRALLRVEE